MSRADLAIETRDLTKKYRSVTALQGLSMAVPRGEVFGFLGPNGAGKTTAVKLLVGLARPTSGTARVFGGSPGDRTTRTRIGYLPELFRYQSWLSAREVLTFHCELAGLSSTNRERHIQQVLSEVGLTERSDDRVGTFSKGMQQRLGLGVALLGEPELVFLDEPTSALDPVGRYDVRELIRDLKARGATVFLNSHLLSEVEMVCDRVAVVDQGRVVATGTLDELTRGAGSVRLQISAPDSVQSLLEPFGSVDRDESWYTVNGVDTDAIPDLVARLVQAGARVHAVEPQRQSLEDRFLELLREPSASHQTHVS